MIKNYIKIAWRNLIRNKLFSAINIIGLSVGIACCAIIYLYVSYELSYDTYNEKADRVYRLTTITYMPKKTEHFVPTSPIVVTSLNANFPEIKNFVRFDFTQRSISYKDKKFDDARILYADSGLFDLFSFELIEGDPQKALAKPYSIVLTESSAKKYFGNEPAFGKMVQFSDSINLMVTGIMKDIPRNTHFSTDVFLSASTRNALFKNSEQWKDQQTNWFNCNTYSYILLGEHVNYKTFESKINTFLEKEMTQIRKDAGMTMHMELQPLKDIHLRSHLFAEFRGSVNGNINYVYIFSGAAILILLIACCNFINLSTTRSLNRSKEIGLRKVIGAERSQLISQFLGESLVFTGIASVISFILVMTSLPIFNSLLGVPIYLNPNVIWLYLGILIGVGILAGLYPALLMSSFAPIQSLKGKISHGVSDIIFRKGLVVFQFSIAILLIIGTTLILKQLDYMQNRNIGMNKDQVLVLKPKRPDATKSELLLKELKKNPHVVNGSLNDFSFKGVGNVLLLPEGSSQNETTSSYIISGDENFLTTYQIKLSAGRDFSKDFATDAQQACIVNEAAVEAFGWKKPKEAIGKKIYFGSDSIKVVGIVKDFNFVSLQETIKPLLILFSQLSDPSISLCLKTNDLSSTMKELEATWKGIATQSPFEYKFLKEEFDTLYRSEQSMRNVLSAFTFLSIFVACLGLFGLASFTIKQRTKEIGIRKVLGSNVTSIVGLLSKDFLKLVAISFIIASPVGWYAMNKWLQDYAYKIDIGSLVFIIAGLLAFVIAFLTVSLQALKAALTNPVKSLRTE